MLAFDQSTREWILGYPFIDQVLCVTILLLSRVYQVEIYLYDVKYRGQQIPTTNRVMNPAKQTRQTLLHDQEVTYRRTKLKFIVYLISRKVTSRSTPPRLMCRIRINFRNPLYTHHAFMKHNVPYK